MNKPVHPLRATSPAYEDDAYGWALAQSQLIRDRNMDAVDWENVAEEIESTARSEFKAAESALRVVLLHLLKWEHQPLYRSRSWENSIREHIGRFDREIADNPSLKSRLDDLHERAYHRARFEAAQETGLLLSAFPDEPPSWDKIRAPLQP